MYELWVSWWVLRKQIIPSIDVNLGVWAEICDGNYKNYSEIDTGTTYYNYQSYLEGTIFHVGLVGEMISGLALLSQRCNNEKVEL